MKLFTIFLLGIALITNVNAKDNAQLTDAEAIALKVTKDLNQGQISDAVAMFHPDALNSMKKMVIKIAETSSPRDQRILFRDMGVESFDELYDADPYSLSVVMMKMADKQKAPQMKRILKYAEYEVVGSVTEDDMTHVVLRSKANIRDVKTENIVAVSVKKHEDKWLYLGSGQLPVE